MGFAIDDIKRLRKFNYFYGAIQLEAMFSLFSGSTI
jgi:hypothetical protein